MTLLRGTPRYKIELLASPRLNEWTDAYTASGRRHRYVDEEDAREALKKLRAIQPQASFRISAV